MALESLRRSAETTPAVNDDALAGYEAGAR
jgi:hypothetical protein